MTDYMIPYRVVANSRLGTSLTKVEQEFNCYVYTNEYGLHGNMYRVSFESEQDYILFMLRWS